VKKPLSITKEEKTGFKINQKLIQISLIVLAIIGTSCYWLDDRPEVYQTLWLVAAAIWCVVIFISILLIINKTRFGYFMAGILSWITLAFLLVDNFHVVFGTSLIASQPSELMTIRNFIGILFASITVVTSHNLFHKTRLNVESE
jgi:hypothetical protein